MEKITRDNYERYMMDYLEGHLLPEQVRELEHFLDSNPDLREEMKDLEQMYLVPSGEAYEAKDELKKQLTLDEPGYSHFDELCISRVEGTLTRSQEELFDRMLEESGEKQKIYQQYAMTRLQPDPSAIYPYKASLKKKDHKVLSIWNIYSYITLAASVALLVGLYALLPSPHEINTSVHTPNAGMHARELPVAESQTATSLMGIDPATAIKIDHKKLSSQLSVKVKPVDENRLSQSDGPSSLASIQPLEPQLGIDGPEPVVYASLAVPHIPGAGQPAREIEFDTYQKLDRFFKRRVNYALQQRPEFSVWDIAGAGLNGISKITGKELALERRYNQRGELQTLALQTENFRLSTKINE